MTTVVIVLQAELEGKALIFGETLRGAETPPPLLANLCRAPNQAGERLDRTHMPGMK